MSFFAQRARTPAAGCYSDLASFITTFVSYSQTKKKNKFKGTFFFNLPGSFPSGPEQRERTAWISSSKKHIICFFWHTCQTAFQIKACLLAARIKSERFGFRWQTWDLQSVSKQGQTEQDKKQTKKKQKKKTGATKEHLPPPAHVVGPNSGSPNKTLSSAAGTVCKDALPCSLSSLMWRAREEGKSILRLVSRR